MGPIGAPTQSHWPVVACWLLAGGGAIAVTFAFWSGGRRLGDLPFALSPTGLWIVGATVCWGLALTILWVRSGRRRDARVASRSSAEFILGGLANVRVVQQIRTTLPNAPAHLPTRITLAGTSAGVEIWGGPGVTHYITVPWSDIRRVEQSQVFGMSRSFIALKFVLSGEGRRLDVPITGNSVTGLTSPSAAEVQRWALHITQIAEHARLQDESKP